MNRLDVPLPERMRKLDRDPRGYPIPFIVLRDNEGRAHFTINDTAKVQITLRRDLCAICGQKLLRGRWYVGGPGSAFHPDGAYIDGPLHFECAQYALQVCPYLAAPKYAGRLDMKTVDPAKLPGTAMFMDQTLDPRRPEVFVAVMATGHTQTENGYLQPKRPYMRAQIWQEGKLIEELDREAVLYAYKKFA